MVWSGSMRTLSKLTLRIYLGLCLLAGVAPALAATPAEDALVQRLARHHAYTGLHSENTGAYAAYLATRLKLASAEVERCRAAGRLHDLGKLRVPVALLDKPGKPTADEWRQIQQHPARGEQLARAAGVDAQVAAAIGAHHERIDGKGYPQGLKGDAIPLPARIVAVADTFDAVTTRRSYQPARPFGEAVKILRQAAGTQLDPVLVGLFADDADTLAALLASRSR